MPASHGWFFTHGVDGWNLILYRIEAAEGASCGVETKHASPCGVAACKPLAGLSPIRLHRQGCLCWHVVYKSVPSLQGRALLFVLFVGEEQA